MFGNLFSKPTAILVVAVCLVSRSYNLISKLLPDFSWNQSTVCLKMDPNYRRSVSAENLLSPRMLSHGFVQKSLREFSSDVNSPRLLSPDIRKTVSERVFRKNSPHGSLLSPLLLSPGVVETSESVLPRNSTGGSLLSPCLLSPGIDVIPERVFPPDSSQNVRSECYVSCHSTNSYVNDTNVEVLINKLNIRNKDITLLIITGIDVETVRSKYKEWLSLYEQYQVCVNKTKFTKLGSPDLRIFDSEVKRFRNYVEEWFQLQRTDSQIRPEDSASNHGSRKSTRSSSRYTDISLIKIRQEQERAVLLEKQKLLIKRQQMEKEKLEIKLREEQLNLWALSN
ncbi:uncharacterized protein LOC130014026 [Patella vulgata]|uniref:uncharacterized protein LOC130014026 n=1 Tax=Patella vulgata TaxID=6465 RepID=UPI0024A9F733|nr:uncharacterized protein LOC130014026 [Patella vulgata]